MRQIGHADIAAAAEILRAIAEPARDLELRRMLAGAELAHEYRLKTGKLHPFWGDGSLASAAHSRERGRPPASGPGRDCQCFVRVFEALVEWQTGGRVSRMRS